MNGFFAQLSQYQLLWFTLLGLSLFVAGGHLTAIIGKQYAQKVSSRIDLRRRQAFLLRTIRHLGAFWLIILSVAVISVLGMPAAILIGILISYMGLREFVTLTPVRIGDHSALSVAFFVLIPVHYLLIGLAEYGLFTVLIPVYAFLLLPVFSIMQQDVEDFLTRKATLQWGLMVAVYCVSHTVALLNTEHVSELTNVRRAMFLLFFLLLLRTSMMVQHFADYFYRDSPKIAPLVHRRATFMGLAVSVGVTAVLGFVFVYLTPLHWYQGVVGGALIALAALVGRMVMASICLSMGMKDWREVAGGSHGVLDRLDGFIYAAPVFFHFVQFVTI